MLLRQPDFCRRSKKTLFLVRTGWLSQHDQLAPAKHIFGKSALAWLGSIDRQQWVTDGPASAELQPSTQKYGRLWALALLLCDRLTDDAIMPIDDAFNAACHLTG